MYESTLSPNLVSGADYDKSVTYTYKIYGILYTFETSALNSNKVKSPLRAWTILSITVEVIIFMFIVS